MMISVRYPKIKFSTLAIMLMFCISLFASSSAFKIDVYAAEQEGTVICLDSRHLEENKKFEAVNLFPGDYRTQYYRVSTNFRDTVTVHFGIQVREGSEKLGEVLQLRVTLLGAEQDEILYEGSFNNLVNAVDHILVSETGEKTQELVYEITAFLTTDVTNEYQGQALVADFTWWVEENEDSADDSAVPPADDSGDDLTDDSMNKPASGSVASPDTGDNANILLSGLALIVLLLLLLLVIRMKKHAGKHGKDFCGKLFGSITGIVVLALALGFTTFAWAYSRVSIEENLFETGRISINLNDGVPVITEDEFLFEPGITVIKDFFLENNGTGDVYYRLYFSNIEGDLADVLEVTVKESDRTLYSGLLGEMLRANVGAADDLLAEGERRELTISFHCPEEKGNDIQKRYLSFDINADAVQILNNPDRQFD